MALFSPSGQNPLGLHPGKPERVRVKMRDSAGSQGQVVKFLLLASDDASGVTVASTDFGGATNPTSNVELATNTHDGTGDTNGYLYGILAEDIASAAEGWCYIRGVVQALGGDTSVAGKALTVGAGSELITVPADSANCIAINLETLADATLAWVIFDGINGFAKGADVA